MNEGINYRKSNERIIKAWLAYKAQYSGAGVPSVADFVAGYNAGRVGTFDEIREYVAQLPEPDGLLIKKDETSA